MNKQLQYIIAFILLTATNFLYGREDTLLLKYKNMSRDTAAVSLIIKDSKHLRYNGNYDAAVRLMRFEDSWIKQIKDELYVAQHYNSIGLAYDYAGKFDSAIVYYKKSSKYFHSLKKYRDECKTIINIGVAYSYSGDNKKSLIYYLKALKLSLKYNVEEMRYLASMNIGGIYFESGKYALALSYFRESIPPEKYYGSYSHLGNSFYNMGCIYFKLQKFDSAEVELNKAIAEYTKTGDWKGVADSKAILGAVMRNLNQYQRAAVYYEEAMDISRKLNIQIAIETYSNVGVLYAYLKDKKKAYAYSDTALYLAKQAKSKTAISKAYHVGSNIDQLFGDFTQAYWKLNRFVHMQDSLFADEKLKELDDLRTQYEVDKKSNEIKIAEKIKREKQKAALEAKAEEQEARNRTIIFSVMAILVLIAVFAVVIFQRFRVTQKQNKIITLQKKEVEHQKELVEEKNNEILSSINYAKRIQTAILPPQKIVKEYLPESFILYKPKDIVAGDFYWLEHKNDWVYFAAADCTGHGVPGAMVSVICNNGLNRSVREYNLVEPGEILDKTREIVIAEFEKSDEEVKDGMDISLCGLSLKGMKLKWAGANNPLWIIRNNEIIEVKPNKQPIGKYADPELFITHEIDLKKGDLLYIFTDGYQDQFGGEKGKKFRAGKLKEVLLFIQKMDMKAQQEFLNNKFENWKGSLEQIDDVCIIGVRV